MVMNDGLLRVFWPYEFAKSTAPGVIVGWRNSEFDLFVVSVLEHVEARNVDNALRTGILYRSSPHPISRLLHLCGKSAMHVLGSTNAAEIPTAFTPSHLYAVTNHSSKLPRIYCPPETKLAIQVIMFHRPHPTRMQYMSPFPMSLVLGDKRATVDTASGALGDVDAAEEAAKVQSAKLVNKLRLHTVVKHLPTPKEQSLPCWRTSGRVSNDCLGSICYGGYLMYSQCGFTPIIKQGLITGIIVHRVIAEVVLTVLEWRARPDAAALKDISATAQQVDIRLQQFCYWPIQYLTLRKRKNDWESVTHSHPDYIRFYNSLWLVANDVIIGIALGSYLIDNADWVASQMNSILNGSTVEGLQQTISWLMDWPAGLKLNNELAAFLGDLFLWVIEHWASALVSLRPFLRHVVYMIGCSGFAGASMALAMFSDLLSLFTIHIYSFYTASARIFHWQLTIIISLFHLFRGRKRNVLRNRIDSCDYELDQLLLGTILFTLLFFLLPTILVFYITFASARMAIISLKATLDTCLAMLNHFPLFALMLRLKDPRRLPGGIKFELRKQSTPNSDDIFRCAPTSYINLQSVPLSLRSMFEQYFQLGHRLRKHYLSPRVILCLVTGRFVPPIHRRNMYSLQYSMLPARRVGISEIWSRLTERSHTARTGAGRRMPGVVGAGGGSSRVSNGFVNLERRRNRG
ncbi:hypothetical protein CIRG_02088 [Coccidioides immitis RMSCC 2394]|uniref:Pig-Q n=1 Tax=Coccidioides immitis RMSCC 2394 TaxID=404692 RepID=A0A0J6Y4H8_COCIT|nr:hypothetical protein CIRG_02088 [Coccidioides immitis RMSCC 2394]